MFLWPGILSTYSQPHCAPKDKIWLPCLFPLKPRLTAPAPPEPRRPRRKPAHSRLRFTCFPVHTPHNDIGGWTNAVQPPMLFQILIHRLFTHPQSSDPDGPRRVTNGAPRLPRPGADFNRPPANRYFFSVWRVASQSRVWVEPSRSDSLLPLMESPASLPSYLMTNLLPLNSRVIVKATSFVLNEPS